jgi:hypothetical protein
MIYLKSEDLLFWLQSLIMREWQEWICFFFMSKRQSILGVLLQGMGEDNVEGWLFVYSQELSVLFWRLSMANTITRWLNFQGHKHVGRLRPDEKELVQELTENMAAPRNIMSTLKNRRETTIKHIYDARYRLKKSNRGPRTEMHHLMKWLVEGK